MAINRNASEVEQAVSRTLRDSLEKLGRTTDELNQAVSDLVASCSSTRPANSLSPMLRAQTAAASLAASLEVLARFVTAALQPELRTAAEREAVLAAQPAVDSAPQTTPVISEQAMESQPLESPQELRASDMVEEGAPISTEGILSPIAAQPLPPYSGETHHSIETVAPEPGNFPTPTPAPVISEQRMQAQPLETSDELRSSEMQEEGAPPPAVVEASIFAAPGEATGERAAPAPSAGSPSSQSASKPVPVVHDLPKRVEIFDISRLAPEDQELHRRANRVAKVSMQDIKMLHPNEVKAGIAQKDLCHRLRDDIERAHKEYDRRFQTILGHPVDYFYDWMVEILAEGDVSALGDYPYSSSVLRH